MSRVFMRVREDIPLKYLYQVLTSGQYRCYATSMFTSATNLIISIITVVSLLISVRVIMRWEWAAN